MPVRFALCLLLLTIPITAAARSQDPREAAAQGGIERNQQRPDTDNHPPHPLANIIFDDPVAYRVTLGRLHEFSRRRPEVRLVPSHCEEAAARYVATPSSLEGVRP